MQFNILLCIAFELCAIITPRCIWSKWCNAGLPALQVDLSASCFTLQQGIPISLLHCISPCYIDLPYFTGFIPVTICIFYAANWPLLFYCTASLPPASRSYLTPGCFKQDSMDPQYSSRCCWGTLEQANSSPSCNSKRVPTDIQLSLLQWLLVHVPTDH